MTASAEVFSGQREHLTRVAYRVLGSWADAEDVVSEAWLRWQRAPEDVRDARAWLSRVVGRLALDELRSARRRRESYVGPWLPEPDVRARPADGDPADVAAADETLRLGFLLVLERLPPEQRVAFVLHDVVGMPFADVAEVLSCSVASARQLASRGRRAVRDAPLPAPASAAEVTALLDAMAAALSAGDAAALGRLLRADVRLVSDGGGVVRAAGRPLQGAEVGRFLLGLAARYGAGSRLEWVLVNGEPGLVVRIDDAPPGLPRVGVYTVGVVEGRIAEVLAVVAPDKLSRLPG